MIRRFTRGLVRVVLVGAVVAAVSGCGSERKQLQIDPVRAYMDARAALLAAAEDEDARVRTHALETLAEVKDPAAGPVILQSLGTQPLPVLFAAAMAAGDIRYARALPLLRQAAENERTPPKLKCAVLYALHQLGDDTHTGQLGALLLRSPDKWVRATAAMVMGKMGEPSAKGPLKTLQREDHDPVVQLQVVQALALLGDEASIRLLEAFTKSQYVEDRILAAEGLGRISHPQSLRVLEKLVSNKKQPPAVRVAAAASLARLGEPSGYDLALRAATGPEKLLRQYAGKRAKIREAEIASLQTLGVLALGLMGRTEAVDEIHPLLHSPRGAVRVAASRAIMQLLKSYRSLVVPPPARPAAAATRPATRVAPRPRLHTSGGKD